DAGIDLRQPAGGHAADAEPADHRPRPAVAGPGLGGRGGQGMAGLPPARPPGAATPRSWRRKKREGPGGPPGRPRSCGNRPIEWEKVHTPAPFPNEESLRGRAPAQGDYVPMVAANECSIVSVCKHLAKPFTRRREMFKTKNDLSEGIRHKA